MTLYERNMTQFSRTEQLLGAAGIKHLQNCRVAVFGLGGVGSYAVEALARSGLGALDLIDPDHYCLSNLNRQLGASHTTIGHSKALITAQRLSDINPQLKTQAYPLAFKQETLAHFNLAHYDYVVDAIDDVSAKVLLIEQCYHLGIPIIAAMGAGNKLQPTRFEVADIYATTVCPLAKVMRRALKARGIERLKVVYSRETPIKMAATDERPSVGSVAYVPAVAGLIMASEVIHDLIRFNQATEEA